MKIMKKHLNLSKSYYENIISQDLLLKNNYKSIMEIPLLNKIVCNTSSKNFVVDKKNILPALVALEIITGQKAKLTKAHHSIAGFKLRKDQPLGCTVTLRNEKMYSFLEKCLFLLLPLSTNKLTAQTNKISNMKYNMKYNMQLKNNFSLESFPELQEHFDLLKNTQVSFISLSSSKFSKLNNNLAKLNNNLAKLNNLNNNSSNYKKIFFSAFQLPF